MESQPLLPNTRPPIVEASDVEGSTKISTIEPIRIQKRMVLFGVFLTIVTSFFFALACSWSKRLTRYFFFNKAQIERATHMWVVNSDSTYNIVKLRR